MTDGIDGGVVERDKSRWALLSLLGGMSWATLACAASPRVYDVSTSATAVTPPAANEPAVADATPLSLEAPAPVSETTDATAGGVPNAVATSTPYDDLPAWAKVFDRLKFYGDARLRSESSFNLDDADDRHRQRLRVRFGTEYQVNDELVFGARVVTGDPDDPNSPHSTLGDAFNGIDISLDRAFLRYTPESIDGASLTGGKFAHPFMTNPVYGELVWDQDVQPEGGIVGYDFGGSGASEGVGVNVGVYNLLEQGNAEDAFIVVSQIDAIKSIGDGGKARGAIGYYYYTDVTPDGSSTLLADNAGNAVEDTDADTIPVLFVSDFGVLDALAAYEFQAGDMPVAISGQYIHNTRAEIDGDTGWATGVALGSAKKKGDWKFYYQWQVMEQDAVFSAFAQDDMLFQTNYRSHVTGTNYQLTDKIGLHLWGLISRPDDVSASSATSDDFQWRVRLDLNVRL